MPKEVFRDQAGFLQVNTETTQNDKGTKFMLNTEIKLMKHLNQYLQDWYPAPQVVPKSNDL